MAGINEEQLGFDPCALIIVTNIDRERKQQQEQRFFCHFECFRQLARNKYILMLQPEDMDLEVDDWMYEEKVDIQREIEGIVVHLRQTNAENGIVTRLLERPKGVWYPLSEFPLDEPLARMAAFLREREEMEVVLMWGEEGKSGQRVLMAATDGWHDTIVSRRIE